MESESEEPFWAGRETLEAIVIGIDGNDKDSSGIPFLIRVNLVDLMRGLR